MNETKETNQAEFDEAWDDPKVDAIREAEPRDLVVELRVDQNAVVGVWGDGVFATEAEGVSVVNLRGTEIQRD